MKRRTSKLFLLSSILVLSGEVWAQTPVDETPSTDVDEDTSVDDAPPFYGDSTVAIDMEILEELELGIVDRLSIEEPEPWLLEGPYERATEGEGLDPVVSLFDVSRGHPLDLELSEEEIQQDVVVESTPSLAVPIDRFDLSTIDPLFEIDDLDRDSIQAFLHYYTTDGRSRMARLLARSGQYREMITTALRDAGLPQELFYVVFVESGFDTTAVSRAEAVGLWQFMERTGRGYGLTVGRRYDERRDPEAATEAAIAYFFSLYDRFESWPLSMAGYNAGGGHVRGEIRRYNMNDFWAMDEYSAIYDDTRRYVCRIIAMAIIGENLDFFGFQGVVLDDPVRYDAVTVPGDTRLSVFADAADTDVDTLEELNPALLAARTPDVDEFDLHIPFGSTDTFIEHYDDYVPDEVGVAALHQIRFGETVEHLADVFGLEERVIRSVNGLDRTEIVPYGAEIVLPLEPEEAQRSVEAYTPVSPDADEDELPIVIVPSLEFDYPERARVFYQVQTGDNIVPIAEAFGVTVYDLAMWNDINPDAALHSEMTLQAYVDLQTDLSGVRHLEQDVVRVLPLGSAEFVEWDEEETERRQRSRRYHTVRRGETLSSIASRYGVSSSDIVRLNGIDNPNRIRAGTELRVR